MLNSNATCQVRKVTGTDVYGKETIGSAVSERCAIVKLRNEVSNTTVRADSSQSRGHADEFLSTNKILLDGKTVASLGDQLTIRGFAIKVVSMQDQMDVTGYIDHYEITGERWA